MQKTNNNKVSIIIALIIATGITFFRNSKLPETISIAESPQENQNEETNEVDEIYGGENQVVIESNFFNETDRKTKGENQLSIEGKINIGSGSQEIRLNYTNKGGNREIESANTMNKNLELDADLENIPKDNLDLDSIKNTIDDHTRNQSICYELNTNINNITLIDCLTFIISLQHSGIDYHFYLTDLTISDIKTSQEKITEKLSAYNNSTLNEEAFVPFIQNMLNIVHQPEDITEETEEPTTQEITTEKVKTFFEEVLSVNIEQVNQREKNFLVKFQLNGINLTANYDSISKKIAGLFVNDIVIENKPLLIRSFSLEFNKENKEVEAFKKDPLKHISTFYPNIQKLYTEKN